MKLKEIFYKIGLKPNTKFFPVEKVPLLTYKNRQVEFFQWRAPKVPEVVVDDEEMALHTRFIDEGDFAIDVGANIADSVLPIALACGAKGKVLAFEPNPIAFTILSKNASLNKDLTNIIPVPFACTDEDGELIFKYSNSWLVNGGDKSSFGFANGHEFPIPVSGVNPDKFLNEHYAADLKRLKYIKIDVEGLDYLVLKQFEKIIDTYKPYVKFEIAKFTSREMRENLQNFMRDRSYKLYKVNFENPAFETEITVDDFFEPYNFDVMCEPI